MGFLLALVAAVLTVIPHATKPKSSLPEMAALQLGDETATVTPATPEVDSKGPVTIATIANEALLQITVAGEPDLSKQYRVDADGMLTFPMIGRVRATTLTPDQLTVSLAERLRDGYLNDPRIHIAIEASNAPSAAVATQMQAVYVTGEVRSPGRIKTVGPVPLIQALTLAGDRSVAASDQMLLIRANGDKVSVDVKELARTDTTLTDGDMLFVPKAKNFFILGEVRYPGTYILDSEMTVAQSIALAGGLTTTGSSRGIKIVRIVDGKRSTLDAKATDVVYPSDTVQITHRLF